MMNTLMLCGSRSITDDVFIHRQLDSFINRYFEGWRVATGDAFGVDKAAVDYCIAHDIRCTSFAPYGMIHRLLMSYDTIYPTVRLSNVSDYRVARYAQRTDYVYSLAQAVLAIWDGKSKGT